MADSAKLRSAHDLADQATRRLSEAMNAFDEDRHVDAAYQLGKVDELLRLATHETTFAILDILKAAGEKTSL